MSTCNRTYQLDVSSNSDLDAKLTKILGVLDTVIGFVGILIAILVGYLQYRQMLQFNRRQPAIDELQGGEPAPAPAPTPAPTPTAAPTPAPTSAPQPPTEHLFGYTESAQGTTSTTTAASERPTDDETSNGDDQTHGPLTTIPRRVHTS